MLTPRFSWSFPVPLDPDPGALAAGARFGLSERVAGLLAARGVRDATDVERWFGEPDAGLHDPALLPDADRLVERIGRARARGERVVVFGDFDADGLTGLATLVLAFRRLGLEVVPYVPSRLDEGHGLSLAAVEAARAAGAALIVTVDCGTTSVAEVEAANRLGIDVIVTDHHRVPAVLPAAVAVVNPHRPDSRYPDARLAGSGVAFKIAQLLLAAEPDGAAFARGLADLATVGTVADVAPIVGENRAIARIGLERLRTDPRPGIAALLAAAGVAAARVDLETVGFAIAPRLNAAGRVGEAFDAARLLLAEDGESAAALAGTLEAANLSRRDLTKAAIAEARALLDADPGTAEAAAIVIHGPWSVGLVGLVASKLAEELGRPAVVAAELDGSLRASCRSDGSLDLAAALGGCADLLTRFGGHAGAAGFELPTERWDAFRDRFLRLAAERPAPDRRRELRIDAALVARSVDYALHRELRLLAPCGLGNPDPLVAVLGLTVTRVRAATGGHTQLVLRRERDVLDGIAFGWPELAEQVVEGDVIDVVARLGSRRFGGIESLQLEVRDAAPSGSHPEAALILRAAAGGASSATAGAASTVLAGAGSRG